MHLSFIELIICLFLSRKKKITLLLIGTDSLTNCNTF